MTHMLLLRHIYTFYSLTQLRHEDTCNSMTYKAHIYIVYWNSSALRRHIPMDVPPPFFCILATIFVMSARFELNNRNN